MGYMPMGCNRRRSLNPRPWPVPTGLRYTAGGRDLGLVIYIALEALTCDRGAVLAGGLGDGLGGGLGIARAQGLGDSLGTGRGPLQKVAAACNSNRVVNPQFQHGVTC